MFLFLFELSPHNLKSVRYFDSATLKNPIKQLQQIKYKSLVSLMHSMNELNEFITQIL